MAFLWEIQESTRHALQLGRGEGFHPLRNWDAKVFFPMNNHQRSLPIADESVGGKKIVLATDFFTFPIGPSQIPIDEEEFFSRAIHRFQIEHATMGDHRTEATG